MPHFMFTTPRLRVKVLVTAILIGIGSFAFFLVGITNPNFLLFDEKLYVDAGNAFWSAAPDPSPYGPPWGN
jgi:hypothetical protein